MTFFLWLFWIFVLLFQLQWARAVLLLQCVGVHCSGFFCCRSRALGLAGFCICAPSLWSADSVAVAHRRCWSSACGILLGKVLNPCLLCWQMNSLSLSHQGSPWVLDFIKCFFCVFWDDHVVVFQLGWITLMYEFLFSLTFLGQMSLGHDILLIYCWVRFPKILRIFVSILVKVIILSSFCNYPFFCVCYQVMLVLRSGLQTIPF